MAIDNTLPKHTPYDGTSHPFGIGLRPMAMVDWIEVDNHLPDYLAEKHRLMAEIPERVWAQAGDSTNSQQEVLDLLAAHVLEHFSKQYMKNGAVITPQGGLPVDLKDAAQPPLLKAAYLVQEDLVLLRKTAEGWRIVAASVCFPSSWILQEKIGKVMHDVHAPVPGFSKGTRNAVMIERIFDNLQVELPAERFNWSVYNSDKLYHADRAGEHFPDQNQGQEAFFLRVEHQTLRKLPESGDILFGIRIHIDPMEILARRADRKALAQQFIDTIHSMSEPQLRYKGIAGNQQVLIQQIEKAVQ